MFTDLLKIINIISSAVKDLNNIKITHDRKTALSEMLKTYFLLLDSYKDGIKLLESVNSNPLEYIKSLDDNSLKYHLDVWDKILRRQSIRLYRAQEYITSQSYLAIINPDIVEEISKVIGYKMGRLVTLHELGAELFFRNVFPTDETPERTVSLVVQILMKQDSDVINKKLVFDELNALKKGLDSFRTIIDSSINKEEILLLSNKARKETKIA